MEITVETSPLKSVQKDSNHLYQWALHELLSKGYCQKAAGKAIYRVMSLYSKQQKPFIEWVNQTPSYKDSELYAQKRGELFIKKQLIPAAARVLTRKGYTPEAARHIAELLVTHSGGPANCDLATVWKTAQQWPANQ